MKSPMDEEFGLFQEISHFIEENSIFKKENKLLLAFSSGPDSVFLAEFLRKIGYDFAIAHFNYAKRASESDKDEEFAHNYAEKYRLEIHSHNAREEVQYVEGNFQNWAREVRYSWFNSLMIEHNYDRLLTAHHLDDQLESFLMTLSRGSGLKGLKAMLPLRDNIARPLLTITKERILNYLQVGKIPYRVDHSNFKDIYLRNRIRKIIPHLVDVDPAFYNNFAVSLKILRSQWKALEECASDIVWDFGKEYHFDDCFDSALTAQSLFSWLSDLGFSRDQFYSFQSLKGSTEYKKFNSGTHELHYQRGIFYLSEHTKMEAVIVDYDSSKEIIGLHDLGAFSLEISAVDQTQFVRDPMIECINKEVLSHGFKVRQWQHGDKMKPLGMKGYQKKISDLLTDAKISVESKQTQLVLCDLEGRIIWLMGLRISELARVADDSQVLRLELRSKC